MAHILPLILICHKSLPTIDHKTILSLSTIFVNPFAWLPERMVWERMVWERMVWEGICAEATDVTACAVQCDPGHKSVQDFKTRQRTVDRTHDKKDKLWRKVSICRFLIQDTTVSIVLRTLPGTQWRDRNTPTVPVFLLLMLF